MDFYTSKDADKCRGGFTLSGLLRTFADLFENTSL